MNKLFVSLVFGMALLSSKAFAYGTGYSTFPLMADKKLVSAEFTGITSTGGGVGAQVRYSQKLNSALLIDAGIGISGGERTNRIFAGADYELFPDYMNQPRISVKTSFANANEFDVRRNILSVAPTVSKGFSFWGEEAFPFISLPVGLSLDSDSKTYESVISLGLGVTGHIPLDGYRHLTGVFEGIIGVKDSYSGLFAGVSFPIE